MSNAFAQATAVDARGDGAYAATVDEDWFTPRGPNGGYLAAMILRALAAEADGGKAPRSLTCHFLRTPGPAPVSLEVTRERNGRAVSTLSARMVQDGETCVLAVGAFGVELDSAVHFDDVAMPDVPAFEDVEPSPVHPKAPPMAHQFEGRPVLGPPYFSGADAALGGGWIRTSPPHPADAFAIAQYTDAWLPAPWTRLERPVGAPTIDLTIHFRRTLPWTGADPLAPVLLQVSSATSAEGYVEEDALIWAPDGTLLAQSRQLALLRPT